MSIIMMRRSVMIDVDVTGVYLTGKELRKMVLPKTALFQEKLTLHKDVLCARHPPVFHEWFLRTFPDPTSWCSTFIFILYVLLITMRTIIIL